MLLSVQVYGGARGPAPRVSVGAGGTELVASAPGHTQGNLGWVLLHTAAVRCLSAVEKYLSPIFPTKENNSICCLAWGCSPVQTCTEHPLTGGAVLGVPGAVVCVLLWVSLTRLNLPLTRCVSQSSWTQTVFFPTEAWMGALWGLAPLAHCGRGHHCPHTRVPARHSTAETCVPHYTRDPPTMWRGSPAWTL